MIIAIVTNITIIMMMIIMIMEIVMMMVDMIMLAFIIGFINNNHKQSATQSTKTMNAKPVALHGALGNMLYGAYYMLCAP